MLYELLGDEGGVGHWLLRAITFTEGPTAGAQGIQVEALLLTQIHTWKGRTGKQEFCKCKDQKLCFESHSITYKGF